MPFIGPFVSTYRSRLCLDLVCLYWIPGLTCTYFLGLFFFVCIGLFCVNMWVSFVSIRGSLLCQYVGLFCVNMWVSFVSETCRSVLYKKICPGCQVSRECHVVLKYLYKLSLSLVFIGLFCPNK